MDEDLRDCFVNSEDFNKPVHLYLLTGVFILEAKSRDYRECTDA